MTLDSVQPGSVIYCDPPYPESDDKDDHFYSADGFSTAALAQVITKANTLSKQKQVTVIVSNYATEAVEKLIGSTPPTMRYYFPVKHMRGVKKEVMLVYAPSGSALDQQIESRHNVMAFLE